MESLTLFLFSPQLVRMFPELRRTKRVGTFGVAYAGGGTYERCMVNPKSGKVATFVTNWIGGRQFPVGKCQAGSFLVFCSKVFNTAQFLFVSPTIS